MKFYKEKYYTNYSNLIFKNKLNAIYCSYYTIFFKNGKYHNTKNAAYTHNEHKDYYLNNKCYGGQYAVTKQSFTKQSWRRFVKLQVFI